MKWHVERGGILSNAGRLWPVGVSLLAALTVGLLLSGWIWWLATGRPDIPFLSRIGTAEWIVYPLVPDPHTRHGIEMVTVFRRSWWLETAPTNAILQVRAFGGCQIVLNNVPVGVAPRAGENWKKPTVYGVAGLLRTGTNEISVIVTNNKGPPALWLSLGSRKWTLKSDETWQASLCAAVWQPARLASARMVIRKGNPLAGGERCVESLVNRLPTLLLFAGLAFGILCVGRHLWRRGSTQNSLEATGLSQRQAIVLVALAAGLWIILFVHNLKFLPALNGFDVSGHLKYIEYIRQRHALPLANEGWEMHQPPLYYLLCASILDLLGLSTGDTAGVMVLRLLGLMLGLAQIALVFASLRLVFPNDAPKQTVGLILAVFMPIHLYLYHYVTNEILAATLATASVYCCLRILNSERPGVGLHTALGLCLGLALLSKITMLAVATVVLGALAGRLLIQREHDVRVWLRTIGLTCFLCAVVSGWHYFRVWAHFGSMFVTAYVGPTGLVWWQDPGYATKAYYMRFGQALVAPLFSGFNGFADGLYSTLWGDGLCGGVASQSVRPPWNYDLMTAGYLLAVLPTIAIVVGAMAMSISLIRRPQAVWLLLAGLVVPMGVGLIYFPLKYPYYFGTTKAQYGLPAMMSLCAFGAWGMDILTRRWRITRVVLWIGLGTWAINSYASLWIQGRAPDTQTVLARDLAERGHNDAAVEMLRHILRIYPRNASARLALAGTLDKMGRTAEAEQQYQSAWQDNPNDPNCALSMAHVLVQQGRRSEAIGLAEAVAQAAPDCPDVFPLLGDVFYHEKQFDKAIAAYQEALRITPGNPSVHSVLATAHLGLGQYGPAMEQFLMVARIVPNDAEVHSNLGLILEHMGRLRNAIGHYEQALRIKPDAPNVQNNLAWRLATLAPADGGDPVRAVTLAERACALTGHQIAPYLDTLAAAYAAAGRFNDAIATAQKAIELAHSTGLPQVASEVEAHLELYRAGRPYRQLRTPVGSRSVDGTSPSNP